MSEVYTLYDWPMHILTDMLRQVNSLYKVYYGCVARIASFFIARKYMNDPIFSDFDIWMAHFFVAEAYL